MTDKKTDAPAGKPDEETHILPPDYSIKKKIGMDVDLRKIFTPERIQVAQKAIDDTQSDFVSWAQKDLAELEHAYRTLQQEIGNSSPSSLQKIRKIAFSLKSQSGTFGFQLGSDVADSLYSYINQHDIDDENIQVIRKHIDALQVILQQNIQGDGQQIGAELKDNLNKLIAKFDKK